MGNQDKRAHACAIPAFALLGAIAWPVAAQDGTVPNELKDLVMGSTKRTAIEIELDGAPFQALNVFSQNPFLAWPTTRVDVPQDRNATLTWLRGLRTELGIGELNPVFDRVGTWQGTETWVYRFELQGRPLFDRFLTVYWKNDRVLGLTNEVYGPIVNVELPTAQTATGAVYYQVQQPDGWSLALAEVKHTKDTTRETTVITRGSDTLQTIIRNNSSAVAPEGTAQFTEYPIASGSFPDQIWADARGRIWFSQPQQNVVTVFDPDAATFQSFSSLPGTGPDGLAVDDYDRVWTGMNFQGGLGEIDADTGAITVHAAPYANAQMAIPTPTSWGTILVTDHNANRVSEFNPRTGHWDGSQLIPTSAAWVVQGFEDTARQTVWFTCFSANKLAAWQRGGQLTDISVSTGGPSFCAVHEDVVYYSLWNRDRLGAYNIATGQNVEFAFPVSDIGGPVWVTPHGEIVLGTRGVGYIMVFDPETQAITAHQIPTSFTQLKDGMTVAPDGAIWFTETGANKIAKLVLP